VRIVSVVVYLAVAILILNAMLMAVFERIREFGVLKALGAGPGRVLALILLESGAQLAIAVTVGLALAVPGMWFLQTRGVNLGSMGGLSTMGVAVPTVMRGIYDGASIPGPVITLAVLAFLAVLYPAFKAAWVRPLEAMHHH
jgi:putative ABC transport system permease protein